MITKRSKRRINVSRRKNKNKEEKNKKICMVKRKYGEESGKESKELTCAVLFLSLVFLHVAFSFHFL